MKHPISLHTKRIANKIAGVALGENLCLFADKVDTKQRHPKTLNPK